MLPNYKGIHTARAVCLTYLNRIYEAKALLEFEMKHNPTFKPAHELYKKLQDIR